MISSHSFTSRCLLALTFGVIVTAQDCLSGYQNNEIASSCASYYGSQTMTETSTVTDYTDATTTETDTSTCTPSGSAFRRRQVGSESALGPVTRTVTETMSTCSLMPGSLGASMGSMTSSPMATDTTSMESVMSSPTESVTSSSTDSTTASPTITSTSSTPTPTSFDDISPNQKDSVCSCVAQDPSVQPQSTNEADTTTITTTSTITTTTTTTTWSASSSPYTDARNNTYDTYTNIDFNGNDVAYCTCDGNDSCDVGASQLYCYDFTTCINICGIANFRVANGTCRGIAYAPQINRCYIKSVVPGNGEDGCGNVQADPPIDSARLLEDE